ncbi:MAG: alpha/beta hydrolase [Propionivibrio sp.]
MTQPLSTFTVPLPELKTAQLTHGRLTYRETGEGKKRQNLLFLHGLLGNAKSWSYQFQDRSLGQNYRLMAWDAPGFGGSDLVEAHIDAYLAALAEFVDHVAEGPIFLVGHSMGGTLAARYAARYPEQVRRLVLSCTHPGYAEPETAPMSEKFENRMREFAELGAPAYGMRRARDLLPESCPPETLALAAEVASEVRPEGLRRATRMLQLADNRPLLPSLSMPTLILTGASDRVVQPRLQADLLALTPHERHINMPGLGHGPYFQAPEYYNGLIADFLQHA